MHINRAPDELRMVRIVPDYTEMAAGSVLICCGRTRVICTASVQEGVPGFLRGKGKGWLTAEYAMLPGSTPQRKARDGVKKDGRGVEIQRLIGRSLRAACDLTRLGERTIYIDCDVIQADGGTRTASITGAFVALCIAVDRLMQEGTLVDSPIIRQVAAVSVGVIDDVCTLDLEYAQDSRAQVDMNIVMTRDGKGELGFVEVQGTGEGRCYTRKELDRLLALGEKGCLELMQAQLDALGERAEVICKKPVLVLASNNFGKLRELKQLLGDRFDVRSMREMGVEMDVEENGETFEENALIKAKALMERCHCATLADDSGLCVDQLGGPPRRALRPLLRRARRRRGQQPAAFEGAFRQARAPQGPLRRGGGAVPAGARAAGGLRALRRRDHRRVPGRRRLRLRPAVPVRRPGRDLRRGRPGGQERRLPPGRAIQKLIEALEAEG